MTIITEQEIKEIETDDKSVFIQCNGELNSNCLTCPKFFTDCPEVYGK